MRKTPLAALVLVISLASVADAERKHQAIEESPLPAAGETERRGIYKMLPEGSPGVGEVPDAAVGPVTAPIIFLNNCLTASCVFTPGQPNDSRANKSSIVNSTSAITPWAHGDVAWNDVVSCVRDIYAPFNVEIVDTEPKGPHHEAVVAGRPSEAGMGGNVLGVAPFSCGVIHNSITFSFANIASSVQEVCHTVAQETAHAFGLDHEFLCSDPMTYLGGCGAKTFQNVNAQCGEFEARACQCGGTTQNSVARINAVFPDGEALPPSIEIYEPAPDADVAPGFPIRANAVDSVGIDRVQIFVNGQEVADLTRGPFVANAPMDLNLGAVDIEVRATNLVGIESVQQITAIHGERCTENSCPDGQMCWSGACVNTGEGGLGSTCEEASDCESDLCAMDGSGGGLCTDDCRSGECPTGFECVASGDRELCWPETSGGLCNASGGGSGPLGAILVGLFGMFFVFRRRRS